MSEIATVILPFFGLIALGYGTGRYLDLPAGGSASLNAFVFYLALPALFFELVAKTPYASFPGWTFVVTTTFGTYLAFAIAFSFGALLNRGFVPVATIQGLVGSYGNSGYLGPGLTLAAFGAPAAAPTALIFAFDNALLFTLVPLMMALGASERTDAVAMARGILRSIFLHPLVIAVAVGCFFALTGLSLPGPIDGFVGLLRSAAAPCAMFALGITLSRKPVGKVPLELPVLLAIKLVLHPLIVYLLLSWIGGFDSEWVYTAVLMAALPPAANVYAIARRYDVYAARATVAVVAGTAASVVTITGIVILVVGGFLPANPFY